MAEQSQSLADLVPQQAPIREMLRQADVYISSLERDGYGKEAQQYKRDIIGQVELGRQAKSQQEVEVIGRNIYGIANGLKTLGKTSLSKTPTQKEPYSVLTDIEEQEAGLPAENTYLRQGKTGEPKIIESKRNVQTPEEAFRLRRLESADQEIRDVKKEAESFLNITPELNTLSKLLNAGIQTGRVESLILPLKQFASDLGVDVGGVETQEQFKSVSGQLALTFGQKLKGSMSDGDRTLLVDRIAPSVATSEEGNKMIVEFYKAGVEKNRMIRDAIRKGLKEGLDPYDIQEQVDQIKDQDIIAEKVINKFPQLGNQGQQATQPPAITISPAAEEALKRARELNLKKQQ